MVLRVIVISYEFIQENHSLLHIRTEHFRIWNAVLCHMHELKTLKNGPVFAHPVHIGPIGHLARQTQICEHVVDKAKRQPLMYATQKFSFVIANK